MTMEKMDLEYIRDKIDSVVDALNNVKLSIKDIERDYIERDVEIMAKTMDEIEKSADCLTKTFGKEIDHHTIKCNIEEKLKFAINQFDEAKKIYQSTKNTFVFTLVTSALSVILNVVLHILLGG